jgi:Uma2 family endonuclease
MSPTGTWHALVVGRINEAVTIYVGQKRLGLVTSAEAGFHVVRKPRDTVRAPDIAFLSNETLERVKAATSTFAPDAPDLAVEVLSPDDTFATIQKKVDDYLGAGGKLVWVASPFGRVVHVHERGRPPRVLDESAEIDGGEALPGFHCRVAEFFRDLPR